MIKNECEKESEDDGMENKQGLYTNKTGILEKEKKIMEQK